MNRQTKTGLERRQFFRALGGAAAAAAAAAPLAPQARAVRSVRLISTACPLSSDTG